MSELQVSNINQMFRKRKFISNESGQVKTLDNETIPSDSTIYLRNCVDSQYVLNGLFTKRIRTSIIEIWASQNVKLEVNKQIQTIQVDDCHDIDVKYSDPQYFYSVVWTGTERLGLRVVENGEVKYSTTIGKIESESESETAEALYKAQFITRLIDDKLTSEELIRAEKGFPITQRELQEWKERNGVA
ncbi:hypothetical protein G9A89_005281 [Geosiphon pyriformis]|nr:hypothetical protein G9A89_005281 [Geosiphon pyriformis]